MSIVVETKEQAKDFLRKCRESGWSIDKIATQYGLNPDNDADRKKVSQAMNPLRKAFKVKVATLRAEFDKATNPADKERIQTEIARYHIPPRFKRKGSEGGVSADFDAADLADYAVEVETD